MTTMRVSVSVRQLVEFVMMAGDLHRGVMSVTLANAALEGTIGHQHIQESRPEGYEAEVSMRREVDIGDDVTMVVRGRVDGIWHKEDGVRIEEIKTVSGFYDVEPKEVHWAQGKIYAHLYLCEHDLPEMVVQLTYLDRQTYAIQTFEQHFTRDQLAAFWQRCVDEYSVWMRRQAAWVRARNEGLLAIEFPYDTYREGQRQMAVAVYRAIDTKQKLFVEAPTGIGKTMATLFPAVKALAKGLLDKVFFLTAKTIGRQAAHKALRDMQRSSLSLRSVTLTARDKICARSGERCDPMQCTRAIGYYDRLKAGLAEALSVPQLHRARIQEIAETHHLCPYEFSLDLAEWADVIICDYNYVFDPKVALRRFLDTREKYVFLVDEAHNLVDRGRGMFSAELEKKPILQLQREIKQALPACGKSLKAINQAFVQLRKDMEAQEQPPYPRALILDALPEGLKDELWRFLDLSEQWLMKGETADFREDLQELYFQVRQFLRVAGTMRSRHVIYFNKEYRTQRLSLFCLDPSRLLARACKRGRSTIFFSATLRPLDYFRTLLGAKEEDPAFSLPSPFPPEHLQLDVEGRIATTYRERANYYGDVADAIIAMTSQEEGNYLVFFPSYAYMQAVLEEVEMREPSFSTLVQERGMGEVERESFVAAFAPQEGETLVGFVVMGGLFSESIDLVGDRLIGVVVVGVGLPQVCLERNLIRDHFEEKIQAGFDYAYVYPGMGKVLQAAGRLIRTPQDKGRVLLIDRRFRQGRYQRLFPTWWEPQRFQLGRKSSSTN